MLMFRVWKLSNGPSMHDMLTQLKWICKILIYTSIWCGNWKTQQSLKGVQGAGDVGAAIVPDPVLLPVVVAALHRGDGLPGVICQTWYRLNVLKYITLNYVWYMYLLLQWRLAIGWPAYKDGSDIGLIIPDILRHFVITKQCCL